MTPNSALDALDGLPRVKLGHSPTPLEQAPALGAELGIDLYIKRDDCTGLAFGGNKVRQLEFYLGAAVELGIPAAAVLVTAVGLIVWCCVKGVWRRQKDQTLPALGVSVAVLVAVHGLVDSPLYLTANAATFSFLLGIAYAQSWPSQNRRPIFADEQSRHRPAQEPPDRAEVQNE